MAHVRAQIRAAAKTLVTGLATTGNNVWEARNWNLPQSELPALIVYARNDSADYEGETATMGPCSPDRALDLRVEGYVRASILGLNVDAALDGIAAEVETAIYTDPTFGGLAISTELGETEIRLDNEGENTVGVIDIGFNVTYRTVEGLPETAV